MKSYFRPAFALLLLIAAFSGGQAQTVIFTQRLEIYNPGGVTGLVGGDQYDLTFALDYGSPNTFVNGSVYDSSDAVLPASVSLTAVAGNAGSWNPASILFTSTQLHVTSGPSYDALAFNFYSSAADSPTPGATFSGIVLYYRSFTNLDLVQYAPDSFTPLTDFLGGPLADFSAFEQVTGGFNVSPGNQVAGFNGVASPIPEPSTYAGLAGMAAFGLAFWHRRSARRRD
jgi:hypothetical protein